MPDLPHILNTFSLDHVMIFFLFEDGAKKIGLEIRLDTFKVINAFLLKGILNVRKCSVYNINIYILKWAVLDLLYYVQICDID